jgi:hypothetical protein
VSRGDSSFDQRGAAPWLRTFLLPALVFVVALAIVSGLVLGGLVRGHRTYPGPSGGPTTEPTVLIQPGAGE